MSSDEVVLGMIENILVVPDSQVKPQQKIEALKELCQEGFHFSSHADAERIVSALASVVEIARDPGVRAAALEAMAEAIKEEETEDRNAIGAFDIAICDPRKERGPKTEDIYGVASELSQRRGDPKKKSLTEFLDSVTSNPNTPPIVRVAAEDLSTFLNLPRPSTKGLMSEPSLATAREG